MEATFPDLDLRDPYCWGRRSAYFCSFPRINILAELRQAT
jgi:hypothetical protein